MGLDSALLVVMKQADCHTITDRPNAVHLCCLSNDQVLLVRFKYTHWILLFRKQKKTPTILISKTASAIE